MKVGSSESKNIKRKLKVDAEDESVFKKNKRKVNKDDERDYEDESSIKKNKRKLKVDAEDESSIKKKKRKLKEDDGGDEDESLFKKNKENLEEGNEEKVEDDDGSKKMKLVKEQLLQSLHTSDDERSQPVQEEGHRRIENVSKEVDEGIKQLYRDRHKLVRSSPVLCLKEEGTEASLEVNENVRYPLVFPDIEDLLEHVQYNRHLTRWLQVKQGTKVNNTIVVLVEGPGLEELTAQYEDCPSLRSYKVAVEFASPLSYGESIESAVAAKIDMEPRTSLSLKESFKSIKSSAKRDGFVTGVDNMFNIKWNKNDSVKHEQGNKTEQQKFELQDNRTQTENNGNNTRKGLEQMYQFCLKSKQTMPVSLHKGDKFSRLDLVMTPKDMAYQKYPLPFLSRYQGFVKTKDEYQEVTERSPMFGIDCEMCQTKVGSELTRISIVNELHEVVYERLVKPYNRIVDYVTKYSGITAKMMKDVRTRLPDVHKELKKLLPPDAILVGHSLNCDLVAMKMMHPYVIDTSLIFNLAGERHKKSKLKTLCAELLSESIQDASKKGHDSIEDSLSALKLVQAKLQQYVEWGDAVLGFKMTAEESRLASEKLRENDKNSQKNNKKFRLALNAVVDDVRRFEAHQHHLLSNQRSSEEQVNKFEPVSFSYNFSSGFGSVKKNELSTGEPVVDRVNNFIYSEVAVVGSEEIRSIYKSALSESAMERVKLHEAKTSQDVINKVLELDGLEDKKRLIIAHAKSPCVCQVEKWSEKLKSKTKEKDVVMIGLCGSRGETSVRAVFFATVPSVDSLVPMKQVVQSFLASTLSKESVQQPPNS